MNKKMSNFIFLASGLIVGSLSTWRYLKTKYEQIAQEEIKSVKEIFKNRKPINAEHKDKPDLIEYVTQLEDKGYVNYSGAKEKHSDEKTAHEDRPYIITPEKFGEHDDYDMITLIYYTDHILADENNELIEDVDRIIGFDSLNHFGEYEDDSIFVRNDELRCDYEVVLDQSSYTEIIKQS